MADCVVDSSVAVKWGVVEADTVKANRVVIDVTAAGGRLYLLDLGLVETANALWVYCKRGFITEAEAHQALANVQKIPAGIFTARPLLPAAFDLAIRYRIAVYDALFVAAVDSLKCDGVTADVPLVTAVGTAFPSIKLLKNW
jgi:predicted nucleic acid-binding protein